MKIYYNLTKIENGWLLNRPDSNLFDAHVRALARAIPTVEEFHKTLESALISIAVIQSQCDAGSNDDNKSRKIRLEYITELRERGLLE